jgi:hypothetical protein
MSPARYLTIPEFLFRVPSYFQQSGYAIDDVNRESEAVDLIVHRQFHRRIDIAFLLVAANM